ncbi:acyl-CoA-binding protein homolog [Culicoides brevitarsis]|uniref:acyl-CoA-binding protein homolog n=1 Tax=Culicoides brevitarsis TaxID=469753 RepID=UPI00307C5699
MADLEQKFNDAAEKVKNFSKRPSDDELLELYALFKQGTVGDNETEKPGLLDFKGKAKWEAWNKKKGTGKDAAKEAYVKLADELTAKYA